MTYDSTQGAIRMALTGDALITRAMRPFKEERFIQLRALLCGADVAVTNAEMLFHGLDASPTAFSGGTYMHAEPRIIHELSWLGIDAVCTANNHAYDYGENGLLEHLAHLDASDLAHAGLGRDLGAARTPAYFDTPAGRVAIIGVTTSGPQGLAAEHRWRDGNGRPGANMLRYTTEYMVPDDVFDAVRRMRNEFNLIGAGRTATTERFHDLSYGISDIPDSEGSFYMADLNNKWQYPAPNGCRFVRGRAFRRKLVPYQPDVNEILARIDDAYRMADWVIVSMHNHEGGATENDPSSMVEDFARRCIDAGAHVFHGHGPHRDRGVEIYRGRPIFYSIGHFIVQNDTVDRLARSNFVRQGLDPWESLPSHFFEARSGREREGEFAGRAASEAWWRDFVGIVEFDDERLKSVELHPIEMGFGTRRGQRGRPIVADEENATEVVTLMQRLSKPYGTEIELVGGIGRVILA